MYNNTLYCNSFVRHKKVPFSSYMKVNLRHFDESDFGSLSFESICRDGKIRFLFIETLLSSSFDIFETCLWYYWLDLLCASA